MIPTGIRAVVLCAALAACGDKPLKEAKLAAAMPNIPLPPQPSFVQRSAGPDVVQIVLRSAATPEQVAAYYRDVFKRGKWRLVNDATDREGVTVLLADQDGPPLWVRIRPSGQGSLVELSGAVVAKADSATKGAAAKPAS
jgi:hypothetical protein